MTPLYIKIGLTEVEQLLFFLLYVMRGPIDPASRAKAAECLYAHWKSSAVAENVHCRQKTTCL